MEFQIENMRNLSKKQILLMLEQNISIDELQQLNKVTRANKKALSQHAYLKSDVGKMKNKVAGLKMKYNKDPLLLQKAMKRVIEDPFLIDTLLQKLTSDGRIKLIDNTI
jgi:hypothetical protein